MSYRLVFDAAANPPSFGFPIFTLVMLVLILLMSRLQGHGLTTNAVRRVVFRFGAVFTLVMTLVAFWAVLVPYAQAQTALRDGSTRVVEGFVDDFRPMPATGHAQERFTVQGVKFGYSDFVVTPGFKNTSSHGGPIRAGQYVRIHYTDSAQKPTILRLEIRE